MIYLIDGNEPYLIEKKINSLIKDASDIHRFDGTDKDFNLISVLNACNTNSLFMDKNTVLFYSPSFLTKKEAESKDFTQFINYINNPAYETDLIIYTYEDNFNKTLKAYKDIAKNAETISINQLDAYNFKSTASSIIKDAKLNITNEAINKLINICGTSQSLLINNLEVLSNYPDKIDEKCVDKLCIGDINDDIFDLINALAYKQVSKSITILRGLFEKDNSVFVIIASLASQLRFLYKVDYYRSIGYSIDEIASVTNSKRFRIQKSIEKLGNLDKKSIMKLLSNLSNIDVLNKQDSSISPEERLELYIVKNFKGIK